MRRAASFALGLAVALAAAGAVAAEQPEASGGGCDAPASMTELQPPQTHAARRPAWSSTSR